MTILDHFDPSDPHLDPLRQALDPLKPLEKGQNGHLDPQNDPPDPKMTPKMAPKTRFWGSKTYYIAILSTIKVTI